MALVLARGSAGRPAPPDLPPRHPRRGCALLKNEINEFVDLLPEQQRMDEETGYRGTDDEVQQNQDILDGYHAEPWRCSVAITSTS